MGHIAHLRKQFKSLKKYDNIITLILRIKKKIYENLLVLHLNKTMIIYIMRMAKQFRRRFLNFMNIILIFCNYFPLERDVALHLYKRKFPSPKDALCQIWLKLGQQFWRRRFLNFVNVISQFHNYLPLEKGVALHLNKCKFPLPSVALYNDCLKLANWFWRRK